MIAVGLWGAQLRQPAVWLLPVTFPVIMSIGGFLGLVGIPLPGIALGINQGGARGFGDGEAQRVEPVADPVEPEPLHGRLEARSEQLRDRALALHTRAELGLVERTAAHLASSARATASTAMPYQTPLQRMWLLASMDCAAISAKGFGKICSAGASPLNRKPSEQVPRMPSVSMI